MGKFNHKEPKELKIGLDSVGLRATEDFYRIYPAGDNGICWARLILSFYEVLVVHRQFLFLLWHGPIEIHGEWFHFSGNS